MSGLAKFTVKDIPIGDDLPPAKQWSLSCLHGETIMSHLFGPPPTDEAVLAILREKHEGTEHCGCAASATISGEARA